ncbi:MAG: 16S rRNA (guanine(527)-N(7))-methyltransferase RsmG [Legionellales bacterium]|nr:16S rRNA (guanine(527)-N(7))-methyltransferase RsmG [Legionellales bacterium]
MRTEQRRVEELIQLGLQQLGCNLPSGPFFNYLALLQKWNQTYNLTAVRDMESMVSRHLLDSLSILPWIKGPRVLDVGSGAGLPGIPLAIACPKLQVVLLDSNGKKIRFLQEAKRVLALSHLDIVQTRAESYHPTQAFDTVTSRAFGSLDQLIHGTQHLISKGGIWLAMKGRRPDAELAGITHPFRIEPYKVGGMVDARCCVIVESF